MSKNKTKVDKEQFEAMREAVIEQELSARSWKAYYDKMYYSLEAEKLEPLYKEYQERLKKKLDEEKAKMDAFMKKVNEEIEAKNIEDGVGEVKLEEANG